MGTNVHVHWSVHRISKIANRCPTVTEIELVPWNREKSWTFLDFQKIGLGSSWHVDRGGLALQREIAMTAVWTRWERDTKVDPAQARACANPRLITSLTLFITASSGFFRAGIVFPQSPRYYRVQSGHEIDAAQLIPSHLSLFLFSPISV